VTILFLKLAKPTGGLVELLFRASKPNLVVRAAKLTKIGLATSRLAP
jgi:hypothetical protein